MGSYSNPKTEPMLTQEKLTQLLAIATHEIENYKPSQNIVDSQIIRAELHFNRAEIYVAAKEFKLALQDYNFAIDYDAYFFAAFEGRDLIESILAENLSKVRVA